jgi:hypothetical protein
MLRSAKLRLWGGRIAVFALWLQLAVSAGHMHPEELFGPAGLLVGQQHGAVAHQSAERDRPDPSSTDPQSGAVDDVCAICAAMQMVAVAVPPLPFQLRAPLTPAGALAPAGGRELPNTAPFRLFQSRAPPSV